MYEKSGFKANDLYQKKQVSILKNIRFLLTQDEEGGYKYRDFCIEFFKGQRLSKLRLIAPFPDFKDKVEIEMEKII